MHTPLERLQATTTSASTVAFFMCAFYALSSYGVYHLYPPSATTSIAVKAVRLNQRTVNATNNRKHDAAALELHIEGDFRSFFHWNVKQMYISCVASYVSEAFALNEVVVWDRIVQTPAEAKFVIDVPSKYCLEDIGDSLRNREVTFCLEWHVLPFVGIPFVHRSSERTTIRMPAEYDFSLPNFFKTLMP